MNVALEPIADGIWSAARGSYRSLVAEASGGVVAFNTLGDGEALRSALEGVLPDSEIAAVVLMIDHLDHAGNGENLARDVIAHELTARVIDGRRAPRQSPATRIVRGAGETVTVGDLEVQLVYPGPTQGSGNLAAFFPGQRVLFMVGPQENARYGLFPDVHVEHYARSLRQLLALDWNIWVPGRYGVMRRDQVERAITYFDAVQTASQQAFAAGVPIWELEAMRDFVATALQEPFGDLDGFAQHVGLLAIRLVHHYLMGGWGLEDTQSPDLVLAAV